MIFLILICTGIIFGLLCLCKNFWVSLISVILASVNGFLLSVCFAAFVVMFFHNNRTYEELKYYKDSDPELYNTVVKMHKDHKSTIWAPFWSNRIARLDYI